MPRTRVSNLLPPEFKRRDEIEEAVIDAFETIDGGPWEVTIRASLAATNADEVAIELRRSQNSVAFASVHAGDSPRQIADRLRLFKLTP
jgi:hypothetical protein